MTIKARFVTAIVDRGPMEKSPVTVFKHELPVLRAIHGEDNVIAIGEAKDSKPVTVRLADEYARLGGRYGERKEGEPFVEYVFGRYDTGRFEDACRKIYGKKGKKSPAGPADTDGNGNLTVAELKARLDELGVEIPADAKKQALVDLLGAVEG